MSLYKVRVCVSSAGESVFLNDCGEWFVRSIPVIILILHLPYFKAALGEMCVTSYQYKSQSGASIVKSPPFPLSKLPYFTLFVQIHSGVECRYVFTYKK